MSKRRGKTGRRRKSRLSEAAVRKSRAKLSATRRSMHPEDEDSLCFEPSLFQHRGKTSTGWRCLECKCGFRGEWKARPDSQKRCPRCTSRHIQQQDCLYRCLNCDAEYWEFPGGPLRTTPSDPSCPNKECKSVTGDEHPGDAKERGKYVKWLNYKEWVAGHSMLRNER